MSEQSLPGMALPQLAGETLGRDDDIDAIVELLGPGTSRLVTITGPGGVGKTRLAIEAAMRIVRRAPRAVVYCPLAAAATDDVAVAMLHRSLRLGGQRAGPLLDQVVAALRNDSSLLVLDNLEHLPAFAGIVSRLLTECESLTILATSRRPLRLAIEQIWPLRPLETPGSSEGFAASAACQLFVARMRLHQPHYSPSDEDERAITALCQRLDGLPLAIELAAARTRIYPPRAVLRRLNGELDILASDDMDRPGRQSTLSAAIAWSYHMLSDDERALVRSISLFPEGCTAEGAAAVTTTRGDIDQLLASLAEASFVSVSEEYDGEPRYSMLQTTRSYALRELREAGELAEVEDRYIAYVSRLIELATERIHGPELDIWFAQVWREQPAVLDVLDRLSARPDAASPHLRLAWQVAECWRWGLYRRHAFEILAHALLRADELPPSVDRVMARAVAGLIGPDPVWSTQLMDEAEDEARRIGNQRLLARVLAYRCFRQMMLLNDPDRQRRAEEVLALCRETGERWLEALVLSSAADILADSPEEREALYRQSIEVFESLGDWLSPAMPHINFGEQCRARGDFEAASRAIESALAIVSRLPREMIPGRSLVMRMNLAMVRLAMGDPASALDACRQALGDSIDARMPDMTAFALLGIGASLIELGEPAIGACLVAAQDAANERSDVHFDAADQQVRDRAIASARHALGPVAFEHAYARGASMNLDEATALARVQGDGVSRPQPSAKQATDQISAVPGLSGREEQVLRLLASGRSNKEIARDLGISVRTAESHVASVYAKIGAQGRVEATAFAIEHGMVANRRDRAP